MGAYRRTLRAIAAIMTIGMLSPACGNVPPPRAVGPHSDILLIRDPQATEQAAATLQAALSGPVSYQGRVEPRFVVESRAATPRKQDLTSRHLVLVTLLDSGSELATAVSRAIPAADLTRIRDSGAGIFLYSDVWAQEQVVAVAAATRPNALDSLLRTVTVDFAALYDRAAIARWAAALDATERVPTSDVAEPPPMAFDIAIPATYRRDSGTVDWPGAVSWIRDAPTRIVTVFWLDDVNPDQAQSAAFVVGLQRDALWRLHEDTLVESQSHFESASTLDIFAGVWQNKRDVAGGPLITRFVYDARMHRMYAIQALLFAPGTSKHSFVRELRAIQSTFTLREPT